MSVKNKLVSIVGIPAGAVFLVDNFITNMPLIMEGGLWVAGMAVAAMGVEGTRKLVNSWTADKPDVSRETSAPSEAQEAPSAPQTALQDAPAAQWAPAQSGPYALPSAVAREQLLRAYQMGAAAASDTQRLER